MRGAVVIGAALAVLTVRLLADNGAQDTPLPASARAASAAAALLTAAAAPVGVSNVPPAAGLAGIAHVPPVAGVAGAANVLPAAGMAPADGMPGAASVADAPAARAGNGASVPSPSGRLASAPRAMQAASVEEDVRLKRRQGASEDVIYRARMAQLPQADVAQLMEREAVEADWARRLEACRAGRCDPAPVDRRVNVAAYQRAASPSLTQEQ